MHRQSLGSPASKLQSHHGLAGVIIKEDHTNSLVVLQSPNRAEQSAVPVATGEDRKSIKPPKKSVGRQLIHLIPLLTLLCFLILYLSSHDPSQKDLAQFDGLKIFSKSIDSSGIDDLGRVLEMDRGDVLAIRNLRNLQEVGRQRGLHRKIGDF